MNGMAGMMEAQIGIAEAQLEYAQQMRKNRRQLQEALERCKALQQEIAALPGAGESDRQTQELAGLCKQLETAARALRAQSEAYQEGCLEADLRRRKRIRAHKAAAAQIFAQAGEQVGKGRNHEYI